MKFDNNSDGYIDKEEWLAQISDDRNYSFIFNKYYIDLNPL